MAQFNGTFDATTVEPNKPFEPLPDGNYAVIVKDSKWEKTKNQKGTYLELVLEVVDGPYKGRRLWDRLNLHNESQQAVEIAQKTLSAICHATNVLQVSDSAQLHDKPMLARAVVKPGPNGPSNEVKGYRKLEFGGGSGQPVPTTTGAAAASAPNAAPTRAPWQKAS